MTYDTIIIGGGPAGLMSAIASAEFGAKTLLLEKGSKLGTKLAISGGGRCNVTNRLPEDEIIKHIPGNGKFLYSAFSVFNNEDIIQFFEGLGVPLKEEDHGRMFPVSNSAKSVVDALINQLKKLKVEIRLQTPVKTIQFNENGYHTVILNNNDSIKTRAVVIASGGKAVPHTGSTGDGYPWAKLAGHTITPLYPTEVALKSNEAFIQNRSLQGLSLRNIALSVLNEKGKPIITHQMDMIFTHFGISGPAVLRCSQFVVKERMKGRKLVKMHLDLYPDIEKEKLYNDLLNDMKASPKKTFKNILKPYLQERFLDHILKVSSIDGELNAGEISSEHLRQVISFIKDFTFTVNGSLPLEKAFVTGGGVSIKEVIPNTMESKKMNGLYFCGEILDIHGYTGGYNITSALVTGRIAGMNAAFYSLSGI